MFNVSGPTEEANIFFSEFVEILSDLTFFRTVFLKLPKLLKS